MARAPRRAVLANEDARRLLNPKGEIEPGEDPVDVARREFREELGTAAGQPFRALGEIRERGGKRVIAFAVEGNLDADAIASNTFEMEWPPKVGGDRAFRRSIALLCHRPEARAREDPR